MKFKCNYLKQDKISQTGILYKILQSREVVFEEKETKDQVIVHYDINDKQYGICSSEYKPPFVEGEGVKKADILIMFMDEGNKRFASWVLDMKQSVGGEDVIFHLMEQLEDSLKHKNALAVYLDDFKEEEHLGFVTRDLQTNRIQETIKKKKLELGNIEQQILVISPILGNKLAAVKVPKLKKEIEMLSLFLDRKMKIRDKIYPIESYISEKQGEYFVYNLNAELRH